MWKPLLAAASVLLMTACSFDSMMHKHVAEEARVSEKTPAQKQLENLPAPQSPFIVSVYDFQDQTGQQKPNDTFAEYSRAVTQGGVSMVYKALADAGHGSWFTVIERAGLKNLLQERKLIRETREQFALPNGQHLPDIEPLTYAGAIVEGGIVAYESNLLTGGAGAAWLGIGANAQYRRDMVTIYLRLVSVQTGEVLASVNTSKTIYSTMFDGNLFKYVAYNEILEGEVGFSVNEPPQVATRQAIEYGVYSLVMEGAMKGLWGFANPAGAKDQLSAYLAHRDGTKPSDAELNRLLDLSGSYTSQASAPAPVAPSPAPYQAPSPVTALPSPANLNESSGGSAVQQPQLPANSSYVPPAPGQPAAEDRIKAEAEAPEARLFRSSGGGGGVAPGYDVVCTSQGCFPASSGSSAIPPSALAPAPAAR